MGSHSYKRLASDYTVIRSVLADENTKKQNTCFFSSSPFCDSKHLWFSGSTRFRTKSQHVYPNFYLLGGYGGLPFLLRSHEEQQREGRAGRPLQRRENYCCHHRPPRNYCSLAPPRFPSLRSRCDDDGRVLRIGASAVRLCAVLQGVARGGPPFWGHLNFF